MTTLERLRELESKATPGPWETRGGESKLIFRRTPDWPVFDRASGYAVPPTTVAGETPADAAFIVAAVEYVRAVLAAPPTYTDGERLTSEATDD